MCCVKRKYKPVLVSKSVNINFQWIIIRTTIKNLETLICCVYITSGSPLYVYESFLESLQTCDDLNFADKLYIIGDFNITEITGAAYDLGNGTSKAKIINQLISVYDLYSINNINNGTSTLDLVLTNVTEARVNECDTPMVNIDNFHPCLDITFSLNDAIPENKTNIVDDNNPFDFRKGDFIRLYRMLSQCNWLEELRTDGADSCVDSFYDTLNNVFEQCLPKKKSFVKNRFPVWFNKELIFKIKEKEHYFRMSKKRSQLREYYTQKFHCLRTEVKRLYKICHNNYVKNIEYNIHDNPTNFWAYVKEQRKNCDISYRFNFNGVDLDNDEAIANGFADFFKSVHSPSNLPNNFDTNFPSYNLNNCDINNITENEVLIAIKSLKPKAAIGIDGIPAYFFKAYGGLLAKPLAMLFNLCLKEKVFPNKFKIGCITPIHKSGNTSFIKNYRPITVLPCPSKIFEKVIYNRMYSHVSPVIINQQHGFVHSKSTVTNLCIFSDSVANEIKHGSQLDVIYTDLAKAFDRVNHQVLILKLESFSFSRNTLNFLYSYLTGRTQFVKFNINKSYSFNPTSGVPQGSILGPLLFVLFVNDINLYIKHSKFLLYADDLKLFLRVDTLENCNLLQNDLDALLVYCNKCDLTLNESKCKTISFTRKKNPIINDYIINNTMLDRVSEIKDLGIKFTNNFSFNSHVLDIVSEGYRKLSFITRSSKEFNYDTCILLFNSYVRSKLEYGAIIWNPKTTLYSDMLEKIQKKLLRTLFFRKHNSWPLFTSYTTQLLDFNINSLQKRRNNSEVLFIFNVFNKINDPDILAEVAINVPDIRLRKRDNIFKITNIISPVSQCLITTNEFIKNHDIDFFNIRRSNLLNYM